MTILETSKGITFVRLPSGLQRVIPGGCQCAYCKAHPAVAPKWDTLATDGNSSWTIHYPYPEVGRVAESTAKAV